MTDLDGIWGSVVNELMLDLVHQTLILEISVPSHLEKASHHRLRFEGVSDFRFANRIPGPWSYVELTEVRVRPTTNGRIVAELLLWSEEASLNVEAERATLDDFPLG